MVSIELRFVDFRDRGGRRIPREILKRCRISDALELSVVGKKLVLAPVQKSPREDWEDAAKRMAAAGDDEMLLPGSLPEDADLEW